MRQALDEGGGGGGGEEVGEAERLLQRVELIQSLSQSVVHSSPLSLSHSLSRSFIHSSLWKRQQ